MAQEISPDKVRVHVRELLQAVCMTLVDQPESVQVVVEKGERTTVFRISAAQTDIGKIIGKQGKKAAALREIVNGIAAKYNIRMIVEIYD